MVCQVRLCVLRRSAENSAVRKNTTSPTGWWLAGLLEKNSSPERKAYWNNYRLVRADHWRTAFKRAVEMGQNDSRVGSEAFSGSCEFIGVSDLVPIYDDFEDGAEILWEELDISDDVEGEGSHSVYTESDLESVYESKPAEQGVPPKSGRAGG